MIAGLAFLSFIFNPALRHTAGILLLLVGVVGLLWSGIYLVIDLFFTTHEVIAGSDLHRFHARARQRYLIFFICSLVASIVGAKIML